MRNSISAPNQHFHITIIFDLACSKVGYCEDARKMAVVRLPVGAKYIPLHKTSRSAQTPGQTPIQLVPAAISPWIKLSIRDADHSP